MRASYQHQMRTDAPGRGVPVGGVTRRFTPAADDAQGGLHSLPVGANRRTSRLFNAPPYTCRGLHCATAFSILRCARLSPRAAAPRRHVCILPNGRAATQFTHAARGGRIGELRYAARLSDQIVRAVMAARRQFSTPKHIDCQVTYRSECHFVQRLSAFVGFNTDEHSERHLEPCSLIRGKSFPR